MTRLKFFLIMNLPEVNIGYENRGLGRYSFGYVNTQQPVQDTEWLALTNMVIAKLSREPGPKGEPSEYQQYKTELQRINPDPNSEPTWEQKTEALWEIPSFARPEVQE